MKNRTICNYSLLFIILLRLTAFKATAGTADLFRSQWFIHNGGNTAHLNGHFQSAGTQDTPEITITVDDKLPCPGQPVTFKAAVTSGGSNPSYQWQINGFNKGTDSPVFTLDPVTSKLASTDAVRCIVTNTDNGLSTTSNIISSIVVMEIPISKVIMYYDYDKILPELTVCQGTAVKFYFGVNFGNSYLLDPSFSYVLHYQLNGVDLPVTGQGADLSPYVKNGNVLTVWIAYTSKCFSGSVVSNQTIIYVTPTTAPSVTIAADSSSGCAGLPVTYRASSLNAGKKPAYQWLLNGEKAGPNDSTFTSSTLKTGDQLLCQVTSSNACVAGAASSNTVTVNLLPVIPNSVSISSTITAKYIIPGQSVTFTAQVPDTTSVTYQWQVNGKNAGTSSRVFTSASFALGDVVTCLTTKVEQCVVPRVATSNAITILILTPVVIPNTFTPNGDGINDTWNLRALLVYPGCLIQVFNRYGAIVYQSIGYTSGWDGTSSGKPLPVGTYYYLIDLETGEPKLSGSVTVIR